MKHRPKTVMLKNWLDEQIKEGNTDVESLLAYAMSEWKFDPAFECDVRDIIKRTINDGWTKTQTCLCARCGRMGSTEEPLQYGAFLIAMREQGWRHLWDGRWRCPQCRDELRKS